MFIHGTITDIPTPAQHVDNECRTAAVIRTNGLDIRRRDGISRTEGHNEQTEWSTVCRAP